MSLVNKTDTYQRQIESSDRKPQARGVLLTLVCIALFLVLTSLIFPPANNGGAHTSAVSLIGP